VVVVAAVGLVAGCGPGPSPTAVPPAAPAHFAESGLAFDYPVTWRRAHFEILSSFTSSIAWLGTVEMHDPCVRTANQISCGTGYSLGPGTLVVEVGTASFPGFDILDVPHGARPVTIDGLPGYVMDGEPVAETGATASRTWTVPMPGSIDNDYTVTANVRAPNEGALLDLVDGIVRGIRYEPAVKPLPSGQAAADAAVASYLAAVLVGADPAWGCFPPRGSRSMTVTSLPNGPPLERPREATCTTTIEATPMQVWRVTLEMRLAEHDANGGWGTRMTVFVGPDGEGVGGGLAGDLEAPAASP
jgi:hypothetical protein